MGKEPSVSKQAQHFVTEEELGLVDDELRESEYEVGYQEAAPSHFGYRIEPIASLQGDSV